MKVDTNTRQDVSLIQVILNACTKSDRVAEFALSWRIKAAGNILYGQPLSEDPQTYEENLRAKRFHQFCVLVVGYLILFKMLVRVEETIDSGGRPTDFIFLRITGLGRIFLRFPAWMQCFFVYASVRIFLICAAVKKFRWLASFVSVLYGVLKWVNSHNLTNMAVFVALILGVVSALVAGWFSHLFNTPSLPIER